MQKRKLCNFRPMLLLAIMLIIAVIFAVFVFDLQILRIFIFVALLIFALFMLILFFTEKRRFFLTTAIIMIVISIPFLSIFIKTNNLNENLRYEECEIYILGKICENYKITVNGYLQITLDDIEISSGYEIERIDGKIRVFTNTDYIDLTKLTLGTYAFVKINLDFNELSSKDKWELSNLSKGVIAAGFTRYNNIKIYENNDASLADSVKVKIFSVLKSTGMENFDLAYAMIFGDSNLIDRETKNIYQGTGIAHLLAVSGLHVSIVVFLISFVLKKLKVSSKLQIVLMAILLSFYSYLCVFSISVIRASMMAIILNYSYIRGKPYDRLSVLSLLASVILIVDPMQLFNISFILSFMAVLSIILLCEPIKRVFGKMFYNKFARTLALAIAIQIGLTVVNGFYFNKFQPLSFMSNIISIPVATFAFILVLISSGIIIIFPSLSFLCTFAGEIFKFISQYNKYLLNLTPGIAISNISAVFILVSFILLFIISDYCFCNKKIKATSLVLFGCVYLSMIFI